MARIKKAQSGYTSGKAIASTKPGKRTVTKEYNPSKTKMIKEVSIGGFPKKTVVKRTIKGMLKGEPRVGRKKQGGAVTKAQKGKWCGPGGCGQTRGLVGYGRGGSGRPGLLKRIFSRNK